MQKNIMGVVFVLCLSFMCSTAVHAQTPEWVENNGISISYPEGVYITGYGIGEDESIAERRSMADQSARSELSSKFIVTIRSELVSKQIETDGKYYSDFRNSVSSQTQLELIDVEVVHWDDERHDRDFALAVMKIDAAISNYSNRVAEINSRITSLIDAAENYERNSAPGLAVKAYRKTFPLFIELGETSTILRLLLGKSPFPTLSEEQANLVTHNSPEIEEKINKLFTEDIRNIKGCAVSIAGQLNDQYESQKPLSVFPFTYHDTDFSSPFSNSFRPALEGELTMYYTIVSTDAPGSSVSGGKDVLAGTYWIEGDNVRILTFITDTKSGAKKASASIEVPKEIFTRAGVELLPANFQQAMEDSKVFLKKDVIPGSLSLEVWTSKGDRNLIFKENEETEIFVRVNKACYLQVLYHMANGVRLLLYNNYYIDVSKVNQVYTMPDEFYFAPPLGVERLQVFASNEKFDDMLTRTAVFDGESYDCVLAVDYEKHTVAMRGIKRKRAEKQVEEKILTITTVP